MQAPKPYLNLIKTFCKAKSLPQFFILHSSFFIKKNHPNRVVFDFLSSFQRELGSVLAYVNKLGKRVVLFCR